MHKRLYNQVRIQLTIEPNGPILIKSGDQGADPALPDMSFVRTLHNGDETIYLPGSSLKGVIRSHSERLARTAFDIAHRQPKDRLPCDPLSDVACQRDPKVAKGEKFAKAAGRRPGDLSNIVLRLSNFGNTKLASRFKITDAYPIGRPEIEERNGVAIDRVFGSVAVGPFQYEVAVSGQFPTSIHLHNITSAQLGLLFLTLRDMTDGTVRIGFGKSRGLGAINVCVNSLSISYPMGGLREEGNIINTFLGLGALVGTATDRDAYRIKDDDHVRLNPPFSKVEADWLTTQVTAPTAPEGGANWKPFGRVCVEKWSEYVRQA